MNKRKIILEQVRRDGSIMLVQETTAALEQLRSSWQQRLEAWNERRKSLFAIKKQKRKDKKSKIKQIKKDYKVELKKDNKQSRIAKKNIKNCEAHILMCDKDIENVAEEYETLQLA